MSVETAALVTCDECGKQQNLPYAGGMFSVGKPHGWVTLSLGSPYPAIGTATTYTVPQSTDLCSWSCVAAYAAKLAETA